MFDLYLLRRRMTHRLTGKRTTKYAIITAALVLYPIMLAYGVETISRGSFADAWTWIAASPALFALNALLYAFLFLLVYCVFGSLLPSAGMSMAILFIAALITYFKTKLIGQPFYPWDIFLRKEGTNIIPIVTSRTVVIRVAVVAAIVAAVFLLRLLLPRFRLPVWSRIALGVLSIAALYGMAERTPMAQRLFDRAGVGEIVWNQQQNYGSNGFGIAFTLNIQNAVVSKPPGYSDASIATVAQQITDYRDRIPAKSADKQPNVIFIMNEAFWDPTLLPGVTFSEDPVPTVHRLQQESSSGYLLSSQFGGGTSNVEFEVLTGNSMSFLPSGSVPYQQYIRQPLPSLASYFGSMGYKSMGIHSYDGWFWNRDTVYKWLGFESFKSKEYFTDPEINGAFISDDEVSRSIIQAVDESERPMFIYAITMQNHGPYDDNRYGVNDISVSGDLTPDAKSILETYTQGARDADRSLQLLIDHFEQSDEPTMIVFYGDHLPMLGLDYDVYKQGGFISTGDSNQWTLDEMKSMHSVPFVTWSNFALPAEQIPILSDSFLGGYILDRLDLDLPANFAFGYNVSQQIPGLMSGLVVDSESNLSRTVPEAVQPLIDQYRDLQYDLLFGKRLLAGYVDADYLNQIERSDYNEEFKAPKDPDPAPVDESA